MAAQRNVLDKDFAIDFRFRHRVGGNDVFAVRAIEVLVKNGLTPGTIQTLMKWLLAGGSFPSRCLTIQRREDERLKVQGTKYNPHHLLCMIFKYPLVSAGDLRSTGDCPNGYALKKANICINPWHYTRVVPRVTDVAQDEQPLLSIRHRTVAVDDANSPKACGMTTNSHYIEQDYACPPPQRRTAFETLEIKTRFGLEMLVIVIIILALVYLMFFKNTPPAREKQLSVSVSHGN